MAVLVAEVVSIVVGKGRVSLNNSEMFRKKVILFPPLGQVLQFLLQTVDFALPLITLCPLTVIKYGGRCFRIFNVTIQSFIVGKLELRRTVVVQKRTGVVLTVDPLTALLRRLERYVLLDALDDRVVLFAPKDNAAEVSPDLYHFLVPHHLAVE
jgi:hypothetical protein